MQPMTTPQPSFRSRRCWPPMRWGMLMLVLALLGCSSTPSATSSTPAPTVATVLPASATLVPSPVATLTPSPEPTAAPNSLTIWANISTTRADALRQILEDAAQSSGIIISLVPLEGDSLRANIQAARLADLPLPDLFLATGDDLERLRSESLIQPVAQFPAEETLQPATLASATANGQYWGTPLLLQDFLLLLYNKKLVDAAPNTSDGLIAQAKSFAKSDYYGIVAGWSEPRWLAAWLAGSGGALANAEGAPTLNTPEMITALNIIKELRQAGPPSPSTYDRGVRLFRNGDAVFAIDGDWSIQTYRSYSETLDLGIAPMPAVSATGKTAAAPPTTLYLASSASLSETQQQEAETLAQTLLTSEMQLRLARELGVLPALRAALDDPQLLADPALSAAAAQLSSATPIVPNRGIRCAWSSANQWLATILMGNLSQEDGAKQMQTTADSCMS